MQMKTGLFAVAFVAVLAGGAAAQGDDLAPLAASNPNLFVKQVQERLAGLGYYSGEGAGLLGSRTIAAINAACRDADLLATCRLGPLTPQGAKAVVSAIDILTAKAAPPRPQNRPAPQVAAQDAPANVAPAEAADEQPAPAVASEDEPVTGWSGAEKNGLVLTPNVAGETVTVKIVGTAVTDDWINAGSARVDASAGQTATFTFDGGFEASNTANVAKARLGLFGSNGYMGELVRDGVAVSAGPARPVEVTGVIPEGVTQVLPYVQLTYAAASQAQDTLVIDKPKLALD